MPFHSKFTIADLCQNSISHNNYGSFKNLLGSNWQAIPGCYDCCEWATQLTLRLICLTFYTKIMSVDNCQLAPKRMKDFLKVSKEAVAGIFQHASTALNGQLNLPHGWFLFFPMLFYCQLTIANLRPHCLPQKNEGYFNCLQGGC